MIRQIFYQTIVLSTIALTISIEAEARIPAATTDHLMLNDGIVTRSQEPRAYKLQGQIKRFAHEPGVIDEFKCGRAYKDLGKKLRLIDEEHHSKFKDGPVAWSKDGLLEELDNVKALEVYLPNSGISPKQRIKDEADLLELINRLQTTKYDDIEDQIYFPNQIARLASHGNASAMWLLGTIWRKGLFGLQKNYPLAAVLFSAAASIGCPEARTSLARMKQHGRLVTKHTKILPTLPRFESEEAQREFIAHLATAAIEGNVNAARDYRKYAHRIKNKKRGWFLAVAGLEAIKLVSEVKPG